MIEKKTVGMNINFNNVRKQALFNYISLVEKLNNSLRKDYLEELSSYKSKNVKIEAQDIEKDLENLRFDLIAICCTYDQENEDFKDLTEEIPSDVVSFNPDDDE
jgi:hypothetical protein